MRQSAILLRASWLLSSLVCLGLAAACGSSKAPRDGASSGGMGGAGAGAGGPIAGFGAGLAGSSSGGAAVNGGASGSAGSSTGGGAGLGSGGVVEMGGALGSEEQYPIPDSLPVETGAELWFITSVGARRSTRERPSGKSSSADTAKVSMTWATCATRGRR